MFERVLPASRDVDRPFDLDSGLAKSGVELVVLQAPAPIPVRKSVDLTEKVASHQKNAANEGRVDVLWMKALKGNLNGI